MWQKLPINWHKPMMILICMFDAFVLLAINNLNFRFF